MATASASTAPAKPAVEYVGWKLRAYPTPDQQEKLIAWSSACGFFWNDLVGWWRRGMQMFPGGHRDKISRDTWVRLASTSRGPASPFRREGSAAVPYWERPTWAAGVPAKMLHGVGADFDQSIALWYSSQRNGSALASWQSKRTRRGRRPLPKRYFGAPTFQPAGQRLSLRWQNQEPGVFTPVTARRGELSVVGFKSAGLGKLVTHLDRGMPDGDIKSIRLTRDAEGLWWVGLSIAVAATQKRPATKGGAVGLDRGVVIPVATSRGADLAVIDGLTPGEQRRLRQIERRIAKIHRMMSPACHLPGRRCSGRCGFARPVRDASGNVIAAPSKNLIELRRQVAKLKAREVRRRQQARHTFTRRIVDSYDTIVLEDLATKNMVGSSKGSPDAPGSNVAAKAGLNRSISQVGWYEIERHLAYKAAKAGRTVIKVPAAYTSMTCAACGNVNSHKRTVQAVFVCDSCGHAANADHNAARVIEQHGAGTSPDAPERIGEEAVEPTSPSGHGRRSGNQPHENVGTSVPGERSGGLRAPGDRSHQPQQRAPRPKRRPSSGGGRRTGDRSQQAAKPQVVVPG